MVIGTIKKVIQVPGSVSNAVLHRLERSWQAKDPLAGRVGPEIELRTHRMRVVDPFIPQVPEVLVKNNWVVQNTADLEKFNHFMIHIYHPKLRDQNKPVIILTPGMLCNGNLFRLSPKGIDFTKLDHPHSFANALAYMGYEVVIIHPRHCKWIHTRYVLDKLGVPNHFSPAVSFNRLVVDLSFLIDAALHLSFSDKAAIGGFSMGGMEHLFYLAFHDIDPRIMASIFLATPLDFKENKEQLIRFLYMYSLIAKFIPIKHYHALPMFSRSIPALKTALKFTSGKIPSEAMHVIYNNIPLLSQIFDLEQTDVETIKAVFEYVLEPQANQSIHDLLAFVRKGEIVNLDTGEKVADKLAAKEKDLPPSKIIHGNKDRIISPGNRKLVETLGVDPIIVEAGHNDLVAGVNFMQVVNEMNSFLGGLAT